MSDITVRIAVQSDFPRIMEVERHSYTRELQAPEWVLRQRFYIFGLWVAEYEGVVRGFSTCVPAKVPFDGMGPISSMLQNRRSHYQSWFDAYRFPSNLVRFNALLVSSTAVEQAYQGRGIGTVLVENSLSIAAELGLRYRVSALRCEYKQYRDETEGSIEEYIDAVVKGARKDPFLGLYLRLGFKLGPPLPNYEPYEGSCNYNVLAVKEITQRPIEVHTVEELAEAIAVAKPLRYQDGVLMSFNLWDGRTIQAVRFNGGNGWPVVRNKAGVLTSSEVMPYLCKLLETDDPFATQTQQEDRSVSLLWETGLRRN